MDDPYADPALVAVLDRYGIDAPRAVINLDTIDWDGSARWQVRGDGIDTEVVARYTVALERGELFPAVLAVGPDADGRHQILGGQHRAEAARAVKADALEVYLLDVDEADPGLLRRVAIEHNTRHGVPLSNPDRVRLALELIADGMARKQAAHIVGLSEPRISQAVAAVEAGDRAARLGIGYCWEPFNGSVRYRLAVMTRKRSDTVFVELVTTTARLALTTDDLADLADRLKTCRADFEVIAELERFETDRRQTPGPAGGGAVNHAAKARRIATDFAALDPGDVAARVEPEDFERTLRLLKGSARRIAECCIAIEARARGEVPA